MARLKVLLLVLFLGSAVLCADSYQQIETNHTRIIFEERDLMYGQQVAVFADEVFEQLSAFLSHTPNRKVPVIVTSNTAWANGYFINFPSAIYLYVTSPEDRFLGARTQNWLKSLYIHELTHYLHLTSAVGPAKFLQFLGPEVSAMSTVFMPGWWIEGITTYAETAFVQNGGRGDSRSFARLYQASLSENTMWSLSQGSYNGPFNPSSRIYVTGYLMIDYLIRHYGPDAFSAINRHFAAFPFFGLSPAFRKVTGFSAKEIFTFALNEVKTTEKSSHNLFGKSIQGDRYLPYNTSTGLLGYLHTPYEGGAIHRYSVDGSTEKLMSLSLEGGSAIAFSADKAVFSSLWADTDDPSSLAMSPVGYADLFLLDLSDLKVNRLTTKQQLVQPSISLDGSRIAASRVNGSFYDLVELDADTLEIITLQTEQGVSFLEPALNGDGSKLVYLAIQQGNCSLYLLEQGMEPRLLVGPTADALRSPCFVDDQSILFVKELELYRLSLATGLTERVSTEGESVYSAAVLGDELYYETYTAKGFAVKKTKLQIFSDPPSPLRSPLLEEPAAPVGSYQGTPYHDRLQFNLALPFPFVEANQFQPGVWFHTTSLLRKHSLIGSLGWSIRAAKLVTDITYQYNASSYALAASLALNQYDSQTSYVSNALAAVRIPLSTKTGHSDVQTVSLKPQLSATWNTRSFLVHAAIVLGYTKQSRNRRGLDFFGPSYIAAGAGAMLQSNYGNPLFFGTVSKQLRLFDSSMMLNLGMDVIGADFLDVGNNIALFSFDPMQQGNGKLRLSASLRLPLGLFDAPIPYGGLTGAGLELSAQSAWYVDGKQIKWEGAWAASARMTANMVLGGPSIAFRPFARFDYLFGPGLYQFSLGMDGQTLFNPISFN